MSTVHRPCRRSSTAALLFVLAATHGPGAAADTYCVGSASELDSALAAATSGAEESTQDIRIRTGNYTLGNGMSLDLPGDRDSKFVAVTGGWDATCASRSINPANTVVTLGGRSIVFAGDFQTLTVEGLSLVGFDLATFSEPHCGAAAICTTPDAVHFRYNRFRNGHSVRFFSDEGRILEVSNNLFDGLQDANPVIVNYKGSFQAPQFAFNTIAAVDCGGSGSFGSAALNVFSPNRSSSVHDNIVQSSNCQASIHLSAGNVVLLNNLYQSISGTPLAASGNLVGLAPQFVDAANGDFRLRETAPASPAINAGLTPAQLALAGSSAPEQDLDGPGGGRLTGLHYDIGAFETSLSDSAVLTVTNSNDAGAGSLRNAVDAANVTAGTQTIRFAIPGSCPRFITLNAPLADLGDSVVIDGYSQPGASPNAAIVGNDATLCVVIAPSSSPMSSAFQVPASVPAATSVSIRGIAFAGGFTTAVALRGGSEHSIAGNAFGGLGTGNIGPLGSNFTDLLIRGTAQNVVIGGLDPSDRNTFGGAKINSITLNDSSSAGHLIANNYIGLNPAGNDAYSIAQSGISASASPNVTIQGNVIAAAGAAGIRISGATATGYHVSGNTLGVSAYGIGLAKFSNTTGVDILSGSGGHVVGTGLDEAGAGNTIANQTQAGVWIEPSAGAGTVVRSNSIAGNGTSGLGLGIDLGALGRDPNDAMDADAGPNGLQNAPGVTSSVANGDGTWQIQGSLASAPNHDFTIDLYRSIGCPGGSRADARTSLGSFQVTTSPAGNATFMTTANGVLAPGYVTAVATDMQTGSSSEISPCFGESPATGLFADGFE